MAGIGGVVNDCSLLDNGGYLLKQKKRKIKQSPSRYLFLMRIN